MTVRQGAPLAARALRMAMRVRLSASEKLGGSVCVWRICEALGLTVRFTPLNLEGLYIGTNDPPLILICSERPLPRRVFTGGHELGHHVFGHGSTLDAMMETTSGSEQERLVNLFSGHLLMPPLAVRQAFVQRGLNPSNASSLEFYTIACAFGVGYSTLIDHMAYSLGLLSPERTKALKRTRPKDVRAQVLGEATSTHLVIADEHWSLPTIDVEAGDDIVLPPGATVIGGNVEDRSLGGHVRIRARRPGIAQAFWGSEARFIRVARKHYEGLLKYRHMEDPDFAASYEVTDDVG